MNNRFEYLKYLFLQVTWILVTKLNIQKIVLKSKWISIINILYLIFLCTMN